MKGGCQMAAREKSALYPNTTWSDCLDFVRTISAFGLKAVSYSEVAKKYGLTSPTAKSFTARISASKQFGLITTSGGDTIQLTETGRRLAFPTGEDLRPIELACFNMPPLYSNQLAAYDGKAIPSMENLANILMSNHRIQPSVKDAAAKCFIESATQLDLIKGGVLCYSDATAERPREQAPFTENQTPSADEVPQAPLAPTMLPSLAAPVPSALADDDAGYITQSIPFESGKVARFIIPIDANEDDLLLLRDMFDVLLRRKFKIKTE